MLKKIFTFLLILLPWFLSSLLPIDYNYYKTIKLQSFQLAFFIIKNNFLGFISCIITFLSTLFLTEETNNIRKKSTKFLYPYILLSLFATILSLSIYLLNL